MNLRKSREFEENIAAKCVCKRLYATLVYCSALSDRGDWYFKKTSCNQHWAALRASVETVEVCARICARASV